MYNGQYRIIGGGKWGFINKKGELVIEANYSQVGPFINGIAEVYTLDHKKIKIDKTGKEVK